MSTTEHDPVITVPPPVRQPAYDAIYALIRRIGDHVPTSPIHRNALIWRAVETALDAMDQQCRLLPAGGEVSKQWAAKVTRRNGAAQYRPADDREHAELIAGGIEEHIASLNGPTFAHYDVKQAEAVHRTVTTWPDGSQYAGPWEIAPEGDR